MPCLDMEDDFDVKNHPLIFDNLPVTTICRKCRGHGKIIHRRWVEYQKSLTSAENIQQIIAGTFPPPPSDIPPPSDCEACRGYGIELTEHGRKIAEFFMWVQKLGLQSEHDWPILKNA